MAGCPSSKIALLLITVLTQCSAKTFQILALVDYEDTLAHINLEAGGEYVMDKDGKSEESILAGHMLVVDVHQTMDNDSFGAMDAVCRQLDGVSLLLDMTSRYVTLTMRSLAEAVCITHVSSLDPSYYERDTNNYNLSLNFLPPASVMLEAIRDIVTQEKLTNIGIIYDEHFDLDDKPKRLLRNIPAQHLYLKMAEDDEAINQQLEKIKTAELSHLFLACNMVNANRYLGKASKKQMISFKFNWYVLTDGVKVTCDECEDDIKVVSLTVNTDLTAVTRYRTVMKAKLGNQMNDFTSDNVEVSRAYQFDLIRIISIAFETIASGWQTMNHTECSSFKDTDVDAYDQAEELKRIIQNTNQTSVAGPIKWVNGMAIPKMQLMIKRVQFKGGQQISEIPIGNWTKVICENSSVECKNVLKGVIAESDVKKVYRIVTIKEPPFVFVSNQLPQVEGVSFNYYYSANKTYYYGYCIDLIYAINDTMNFEFVLTEPQDGAYGTMQPDGSWDGMIRELIDDRADIAVAPLSVMAERENVIDFTVPYYDLVGITILMKKPPFGYSVFKFMSVLEGAVWGCVLSAFIIVSILLAVFDKYSPYSYQNNRQSWDGQGDEPRVFTLKEGLWFCMTSLTPQGGGEAPRALSGRLVAATWWVFGFIMIATYTANLAAFLTVSRLEQPIESLDDLAKQFKTKYAPQKSTSTETYFKRMADIEARFYTIWKDMSLNDSLDQIERAKLAVWDYPVSDKFTNMWASMEASGFPETFEAALERIHDGGQEDGEEFAFIGDATQNKHATLTDCELWEVGEEFSRKPYALAVQEGSPLKNELSSRILQLLNQRVLEDLKTKWWEFDKDECPKIEDESDGISIYNIGGVFLVIFIGIGLGLITLAFEYYWYKWRPAAKKKHPHNGSVPVAENGDTIVQNGRDNPSFDQRD